MEALANERWPTLIWVRSGAARLATSDETHELDTGEALWVPAGVSLDVRTAPESVVLPILLPLDTSPAPLDHVLRLVVPPGWEDWLVHRYACMLGYGYGGPSTHWSVLDWVAASPVGTTADTRAKRIPPPYSPSARAVAERLLKGELSRPLSEFARAAGISERTLQRQFATETGVSFARWRRMARVQAAARHLAAGRPVTWVADQVGYRSPGVLAHAFRAETGRAPSRHAGARATLVESPDLLEVMARWNEPEPPAAPSVPAIPAFTSVDDFDIAVWAYRGPVHVRIGDQETTLEDDEVVWLPAGLPDTLRIEAGAILLPVGCRLGFRAQSPRGLRVLSVPPEYRDFLLYSAIANHTLLAPPDHDPQYVMDALWATHRLPETVALDDIPPSVAAVMTTLVDAPADQRSLADFASELGVDPRDLSRQFRRVTSQSFPQWRAQLRMTLARNLMWEGLTPSVVARRLGYAHLSGFSRLFTAANGMTPREFIRTQVHTF